MGAFSVAPERQGGSLEVGSLALLSPPFSLGQLPFFLSFHPQVQDKPLAPLIPVLPSAEHVFFPNLICLLQPSLTPLRPASPSLQPPRRSAWSVLLPSPPSAFLLIPSLLPPSPSASLLSSPSPLLPLLPFLPPPPSSSPLLGPPLGRERSWGWGVGAGAGGRDSGHGTQSSKVSLQELLDKDPFGHFSPKGRSSK